jgi:glycine/D-amino acid oxidase-like deaminating enzyme
MVETLPARIWLDRCARRISELDEEIAEGEARRIARELHKFERTRAMEPEAAVEFVAGRLAQPGEERFERRSASRR